MLENPVLTILYPSELRRTIQIPEGKSVIGRGIDADIRLDDALVSRKHCEISREGFSVKIRDLKSTNGTFVNCTEIEEVELQPNSEFELGTTILKFEWIDSSEDSVKQEPALLSNEVFNNYAESIASFSARNNLPLAALYVKCHAEATFAGVLENRIAKIIASEKRPCDLFTAALSKTSDSIEFMLLVPHLKREEAIEETCAIRDAIEKHKFSINEKMLDIAPKFGFAFADTVTRDISETLFKNAKDII